LALAVGLGAPALPAATPASPLPPPSATETYSDEVSVEWILVPVIVKSKKGYVRDLPREDFALRVDGRPVRFQDFEQRGEAPWSVVLLQDLSGSMGVGGRLEASREAVGYFLDRARSGDEFALATFASDSTDVDVPFTENLGALRESVARWEAYGKTALHDAVGRLPEISGDSRNVKRAAILVTDGVDNASALSANQARELVRRAELPVYVLGLESGDPFAVDASGDKVYRYADMLNLLSHLTGGRYFPISGPDDLKEACATIADDLRYQYVLGFDTSGRGEAAFRRIAVTIRGDDGLRVLARQGYRGTAPAR
jgi:Ca-activated chloride channel family protein